MHDNHIKPDWVSGRFFIWCLISVCLHAMLLAWLNKFSGHFTAPIRLPAFMQVQIQSFPQLQLHINAEDFLELSAHPIPPKTDSTQIKNVTKTFQPEIINSAPPIIAIPIYYYRHNELALSPYPQNAPELSALEAIANEYHGEVELQIYINSSGEVDQVEVLLTQLPAFLTSRIVEIFKNTDFNPGKINDQPVPSQIHIVTGIRPN